jgi:hypothetical protein
MPKWHPHPWHSGSIFGEGPRRPLDRERRARFHYLLRAHRRAHHLTPLAEHVGVALVRRLGSNGQCDPAHDRLADDAGCCPRTVRRALVALQALGLVMWQRRIVRAGSCVDQTSNAYLLLTPDGNPSAGQNGRPIFKRKKNNSSSVLSTPRELSDEEMDTRARESAVQQILKLGGTLPRTWTA